MTSSSNSKVLEYKLETKIQSWRWDSVPNQQKQSHLDLKKWNVLDSEPVVDDVVEYPLHVCDGTLADKETEGRKHNQKKSKKQSEP